MLRRNYCGEMINLSNSNIRVLGPVSELNYFDTQSTVLPRDIHALDAWNAIMARPQPILKAAFWIRDTISSLFGVRRIGGFSGRQTSSVHVGDHLDFFLVEHAEPDCLVLTERDRHLDVMTCISTQGAQVAVTSSVRVHNLYGHIYMIPVGVAHRWIVRNMLGRLRKNLSA